MGAITNPNLRQSGSGRFRPDALIVAGEPQTGDVPLLDAAGWVGTPIAGIGAYDFVLRSRADLLAVPGIGAGPVYTLPSASYIVKAGFGLNAGERLAVPNGGNVKLDGALAQPLTASPGGANPLLDVVAGGFLQSRNLALTSDGAAVRCNGTIDLSGCQFVAAGAGNALAVVAGDVSDQGSRFSSNTGAAILQQGGILRAVQSIATGAAGAAVQTSGAGAMVSNHKLCSYSNIAGPGACVTHAGSNAELEIEHCNIFAAADGVHGVSTEIGGGPLFIRGGRFESSAAAPGTAVRVNGALPGFEVNGSRFINWANAVAWVAGVVNRAALIGLDGTSTVLVGVLWPAANIPTNGLIEWGCQFDVAAPFSGHTAADARVNRKGCTATGALLAETAIVP